MERIRLDEAFMYAKAKGLKVRKIDVAKELWPNRKEKTAATNLSNLASGKTRKIDADAVVIICRLLDVSADFLFGLSSTPSNN